MTLQFNSLQYKVTFFQCKAVNNDSAYELLNMLMDTLFETWMLS